MDGVTRESEMREERKEIKKRKGLKQASALLLCPGSVLFISFGFFGTGAATDGGQGNVD